jgi:pilus assembly protein Flp/PilA
LQIAQRHYATSPKALRLSYRDKYQKEGGEQERTKRKGLKERVRSLKKSKRRKNKRREEMEMLKKFVKEEDGVSAIEYTLIAAVIALGILLSVQGVAGWITTQLTAVAGVGP